MSDSQRLAVGAVLRARKDEITEFHHGDCVGADAEAHVIAVDILGAEKVFVHPPENPARRAFCQSPNILPPLGYLERDLKIVLMTDTLIGCPKAGTPALRSGTWYTIRRAKERGKAVLIFKAGD